MEEYITFDDYCHMWYQAGQMNAPASEYDGIRLYPWMADSVEKLKTWTVREDDVWVVTYPKAGTTWAQEITSCLMHDGDLEAVNQKHTTFRVLFLEWDFPEEMRRLKNLPATLQLADEMPSPRVLKSHLPGPLLPPQLWEKKPKIVYVIRNPKDQAVSHYHFLKIVKPNEETRAQTFDEFLDEMMAGRNMYGPWWDHYLYFWKRRHDNNILLLRFEDMKRDLRGNVAKIGKFLGKELSDEKMDAITEHCNFTRMKSNQKTNLDELFKYNGLPEGVSFMRKGKVGNWKTLFTVAQNEAMDAFIQDKLQGSGLTFDYD